MFLVKIQVWEGYVEGQEEKASAVEGAKPKQEILQVIYEFVAGRKSRSMCIRFPKLEMNDCVQIRVTEVLGGGKFYAQLANDARVSSLQLQLEGLRLKDKSLPPVNFEPKKGDIVMAQFSVDGSWNRAMVSYYTTLLISFHLQNFSFNIFTLLFIM
jgi:hypothetical protein